MKTKSCIVHYLGPIYLVITQNSALNMHMLEYKYIYFLNVQLQLIMSHLLIQEINPMIPCVKCRVGYRRDTSISALIGIPARLNGLPFKNFRGHGLDKLPV